MPERTRRGFQRIGPVMEKLPEALCLHRDTGAVIGFWNDGIASFPEEWSGADDYGGFVTVPIPGWLMDYAGSPFCQEVPRPEEKP